MLNETNNISLNIFESIKNTNLNTEREIKKQEKKISSSQQLLISSIEQNDLYILSSDESDKKIYIPSSLVSKKISKKLINLEDKIMDEQ